LKAKDRGKDRNVLINYRSGGIHRLDLAVDANHRSIWTRLQAESTIRVGPIAARVTALPRLAAGAATTRHR